MLAKALAVAGLDWDQGSAHSATYDAERSAELFCLVCNRLRDSHQAAEQRARELGWCAPNAEAPPEEEPPPPESALTWRRRPRRAAS